MKKEELIQEISFRLAVPPQTASLVLHTIFNQLLIGVERDGMAGIPKLGDWKLRSGATKREIEFIPSHQFVRILGFAKAHPDLPPGDRPRSGESGIETPGYLPCDEIYPSATERSDPVDVLPLYRTITAELGLRTPLLHRSPENGPEPLPVFDSIPETPPSVDEAEPGGPAHEPPGLAALSAAGLQEFPAPQPGEPREEDFAPSAYETIERADFETPANDGLENRAGTAATIEAPHREKKRGDPGRIVALLLSILITLGALALAYVHGYLDHFLKRDSVRPRPQEVLRADSAGTPAPAKRAAIPSHIFLLSVRITPQRYEADARLRQLALQGFHGKVTSTRLRNNGKLWYEVRLGPYASRDSALQVSSEFLQTYGFPPNIDSIRIPQ